MNTIIGIDPGTTGAICVFTPATGRVVFHDMPTAKIRVGRGKLRSRIVEGQLAAILRDATFFGDVRAVVEEVHAMPKQGVSSTFAFGVSYGLVLGVLATLQIPFTTVTPNVWTKSYKLRGKNASILTAARLVPQSANALRRMKDHNRADALLIALWGAGAKP